MFETTISYGDLTLKISFDSLAQLHHAVARVQELNHDADFLKQKTQCETVDLRYFVDSEGNEYFGFLDPVSRDNIGFGQYRDKRIIPFFPKGEEGYFKANSGSASPREEQPSDKAGRNSTSPQTKYSGRERHLDASDFQ